MFFVVCLNSFKKYLKMTRNWKHWLNKPWVGGAVGAVVVLLLWEFLGGRGRQSAELSYLPLLSVEPKVVSPVSQSIDGLSFLETARRAAPAIVHIKTKSRRGQSLEEDVFYFHHRDLDIPRTTSGSGVIISQDGYIITNNHVVENAQDIQVLLWDQRYFRAELIGSDPSTDLALLKIDASNLPYLLIGNSEEVQIGEWVLAFGNPFDLSFTVTAGIISAKARSINIIRDKDGLQVEAFLQTDAVVNPGNSGGALVNLRAELIGINTAIASHTGSYSGYSFAIPSNLVRKVINDLMEYGEVQRALLGVQIRDLDIETARSYNLGHLNGVVVVEVSSKSSAEEAGLLPSDIIVAIDSVFVRNTSQLQEQIALRYPGEWVQITFFRNGQKKEVRAQLRSIRGEKQVARRVGNVQFFALGGEWATLSREECQRYRIKGGAKLIELRQGPLKKASIREGFILTDVSLNGKKIAIGHAMEATKLLRSAEKDKSVLYLEGFYPEGSKQYYPIEW